MFLIWKWIWCHALVLLGIGRLVTGPIVSSPLSSIWSSFTEHPVDIDQLKLIMLLVGTPGPELLKKLSSESVSSQSYTTAVQ